MPTPVSEEKTAPPSIPQDSIVKPSKVLLEWEVPERLFQKKSREFYRKTAVMLIFFAFLFLVIFDFILIALVGVVFFAIYVFHTIPPRMVKHQITTHGVVYASEHLYKWEELRDFFIDQKQGVNILNINTVNMFPGRLFLLMPGNITPQKMTELVNQYISFVEKPKPSPLELITQKVASKINL